MSKIIPTQDRVLVRRLDSESKTSGGIIIPDSAQEKPIQGIVVAVGPGVICEKTHECHPMQIKVGQKIIFTKWSGTEIKMNGEELLIMKESDIVAIIEE